MGSFSRSTSAASGSIYDESVDAQSFQARGCYRFNGCALSLTVFRRVSARNHGDQSGRLGKIGFGHNLAAADFAHGFDGLSIYNDLLALADQRDIQFDGKPARNIRADRCAAEQHSPGLLFSDQTGEHSQVCIRVEFRQGWMVNIQNLVSSQVFGQILRILTKQNPDNLTT